MLWQGSILPLHDNLIGRRKSVIEALIMAPTQSNPTGPIIKGWYGRLSWLVETNILVSGLQLQLNPHKIDIGTGISKISTIIHIKDRGSRE